jgi:V/A-type H+-transporting ATPase subunit D
MELKKLKARLSTAVRGHKLLKDKSDEMVRRFTVLLRETKALREQVEKELADVLRQFAFARSVTPVYQAETAFAMPATDLAVECETTSIMGVDVPSVQVVEKGVNADLPYAFSEITGEADYSVQMAAKMLPTMLALAQTALIGKLPLITLTNIIAKTLF